MQGLFYEELDAEGYGGMDPSLYDAILHYKKTGQYPAFVEMNQKTNRNSQFHWRSRCARFEISDNDRLLHLGAPSAVQNERTRIVVRRGEVKTAIRIIHERHGHIGQKPTQSAVASRLYWTGIHRDVAKYVQECQTCKAKRDLKKPVSFSDLVGADDSAIAERLLLNSDADAVIYEFVNVTGTEQYGEVLMDDMDDGIMFEQEDQQESQYKDDMNNLLIPQDKIEVEVGAEEELIDSTGHTQEEVEEELIEMKHDDNVTENTEQPIRKRRSRMNSAANYMQQATSKTRRTAESNYQANDVIHQYDQPSTSSQYINAYHEDQSDVRNHQMQQQDCVEPTHHSIEASMAIGMGPSMLVTSTDPDVVRLQKKVLTMQHDVLGLKMEYYRMKIDRLRNGTQITADPDTQAQQQMPQQQVTTKNSRRRKIKASDVSNVTVDVEK